MKPNILKPGLKDSFLQLFYRPKTKGSELFGLPYRTAMSLVYGAGFLFGALIFWIVGLGWCPTVTQGERGQQDFVFSLGAFGLVVVLIGTMLISASAFLGNFEETWHRLGVLAVAGGFLVFGLWVHAIHKIEIHPDRFVVRGPFNPIAATYSLKNGNKIVTRIRKGQPGILWWGRKWRRSTYSVHYIRSDGSETLLHNGKGGSHVWSRAASRFEHVYQHD
jgi:hypothetical protein